MASGFFPTRLRQRANFLWVAGSSGRELERRPKVGFAFRKSSLQPQNLAKVDVGLDVVGIALERGGKMVQGAGIIFALRQNDAQIVVSSVAAGFLASVSRIKPSAVAKTAARLKVMTDRTRTRTMAIPGNHFRADWEAQRGRGQCGRPQASSTRSSARPSGRPAGQQQAVGVAGDHGRRPPQLAIVDLVEHLGAVGHEREAGAEHDRELALGGAPVTAVPPARRHPGRRRPPAAGRGHGMTGPPSGGSRPVRRR